MLDLLTMIAAILMWICVGEISPQLPTYVSHWATPWLPAGELLGPVLLQLLVPFTVVLGYRWIASRRGVPRHTLLQRGLRIRRIVLLLTWLAILLLANWHELAASRLPAHWHAVAPLLTFMPLMVSSALCALPLNWDPHTRSATMLLSIFIEQLRLSLIVLLPIAVLSGIDNWFFLNPDHGLTLEGYSPVSRDWMLLIVIVFILPAFVGRMVPSRPIPPGPLRERLLCIAAGSGVRSGIPRIWLTGSQPLITAMIVGLLPFGRRFFLTDLFIMNMTNDEIDAAFAHELAHARQHHVWLFLATGCGFLLAMFLVLESHDDVIAFPLVTLLTVSGWIFFGRLSRHLEHHADIVSDELTGKPGAIAQTLAHIGRISGTTMSRSGWRHPSINDRIRVLHHHREDPLFRRLFDRHRRRLARMVLLLLIVTVAGWFFASGPFSTQPNWFHPIANARAHLQALQARSELPQIDTDRQHQLLLGAQVWLEQGVERLRSDDPRHPDLSAAYDTLASIYARLDRPREAASCRILANAARVAEVSP